MTREEFDRLVQQVEAGVGKRPAALRWRVACLAALGYSALLAGLLLVVLIAAGFFTAMFWADIEGKMVCGMAGVIVLFGGGWAVLKALLVRLPPPEGVPVSVADAPVMF